MKFNRRPPIHTSDVPVKFALDIQSQYIVRVRNRKIQYGCQAANLKVTSLKIIRFLSIATNNAHTKFEIEIPKQALVTFRKPCRLQTDR